jgi:hypothetical protein
MQIPKASPVITILSQINRILRKPISLRFILILSSHLWGLHIRILKALLPSSILATWPAHFNIVDLITLTVLDERHKLWSSSLWSLLHLQFPNLYHEEGNLFSEYDQSNWLFYVGYYSLVLSSLLYVQELYFRNILP